MSVTSSDPVVKYLEIKDSLGKLYYYPLAQYYMEFFEKDSRIEIKWRETTVTYAIFLKPLHCRWVATS